MNFHFLLKEKKKKEIKSRLYSHKCNSLSLFSPLDQLNYFDLNCAKAKISEVDSEKLQSQVLRQFSAFHIWISDMGAYVIIIWKKRRQWYRLSPCHIDKLCIGSGGDRMRLQSSKILFHPWEIMDAVARLNTLFQLQL